MTMPFKLRITSKNAKLPRSIRDVVLVLDSDQLHKYGFPSNLNPDSCIGLYTVDLFMALQMNKKDKIPLIISELWPDIQPVLTEKTKPPHCHVTLVLYKIKFASLVRKDEVHSMVHEDCMPNGGCCAWCPSFC